MRRSGWSAFGIFPLISIAAESSVFLCGLTTVIKLNTSYFSYCVLTPSNVSVSSKHVLTFSDYSHSVWLAITATVKRTCCPAVIGGAVTQLPIWIKTNRWFQKPIEITDEDAIALEDA